MLVLSASPAIAQTVSLSGTVYQYRAGADRPAPSPNLRVFLYDPSSSRWIGPVLTDSYGRFAFYDLRAGKRLLKVYRSADTKSAAWQQEVTVPAQLQSIVLR
jgi:hypothetical protein